MFSAEATRQGSRQLRNGPKSSPAPEAAAENRIAAIGIEPEDANPAPAGTTDTPTDEPAPDTPNKPEAAPKTRTPREGTKQAKLIEMLRAEGGATIDEIVTALYWRPHTVRGALAGALKKKLGLTITSEKVEDRGRVYSLQRS